MCCVAMCTFGHTGNTLYTLMYGIDCRSQNDAGKNIFLWQQLTHESPFSVFLIPHTARFWTLYHVYRKLTDEVPVHDSSWMSNSLLSGENRWLCLHKHSNIQCDSECQRKCSHCFLCSRTGGMMNIVPGGYAVLKIPANIRHRHRHSSCVP